MKFQDIQQKTVKNPKKDIPGYRFVETKNFQTATQNTFMRRLRLQIQIQSQLQIQSRLQIQNRLQIQKNQKLQLNQLQLRKMLLNCQILVLKIMLALQLLV